MLNWIRAWWMRKQHENAAETWMDGYNYAAGELLRGRPGEELQLEADSMDRNLFEAGMLEAMTDWTLLNTSQC